jgi:hypothetical protein
MSFPRLSFPIYAGQFGLALVGGAAAMVYLIAGLISVEAAPGGLAGALADNALFRALLVRIVTAIAFGTVGTVLLIQRPVAGALALSDGRQSPPVVWSAWPGAPRTRRLIVAFGMLSVSLAGLGLVPTLLSFGVIGADGLIWPYVALWAGQAGVVAVVLRIAALNLVNRASEGYQCCWQVC